MIARRVFGAPWLALLVLTGSASAYAQDAPADDAGAASERKATSAAAPDDSPEPRPALARPQVVATAPNDATANAAVPQNPRPIEGVTLAPGLPDFGNEVVEGVPDGTVGASDGSHFDFHGYTRAPLRVGDGPRNDGSPGKELHSPPRTADLSYTDWNYTNVVPGPWTELMLSYGNSRASVTTSIASNNQTIAGYRDLQDQFGINQAFVTLNFPEAFGSVGGLRGVFGSFTNRYGAPGISGGGMYDTYLFGRTRAVGETLTANFALSHSLTLIVEHGIGAKLDAIPFATVTPRPDYLPYPGPVPEGSTFLHHAHLALDISHTVTLAAHYITSWTPDDHNAPGTKSQPGRMTVTGGELRTGGSAFGDGYIGFSHIDANHILPLADAIEVLHSEGGSEFKDNYFGGFNPITHTTNPDDSGKVDSVLFQYTLSAGKIARYPRAFSGNGPDLTFTPFAMWNHVRSANNDYSRLKFGAELIYSPLEVLAFGGRYDLVQPDLHDAKQSFSVLSPKVILRTAFVSHEAITFQYSRYFLGSEVTPGFPYNALPKADSDVFMISASMWW